MPEATIRLADTSAPPMPRKLKFTNAILSALNVPPGKPRVWIYDSGIPGLALMRTSTGASAFYLCKRQHGRAMRIRIGGFPDILTDAARDHAAKMLGEMVAGKDPVAERKAIKSSITLQELWDRFEQEHVKARLRARTLVTSKSRFDTCFADWKTRRLVSIRPADVRTLHGEIGRKKGHVTANRAVQLLRRMFNFARIEPNPAGKGTVEYFRETERERFLQPVEIPRFFTALDACPNETIKDYVYLSLWTGGRRSNVQAMRWDQLDLEGATWTIPASTSKSGEAMTIHLPSAALEILKRRQGNDSDFVLPGHGASGHLQEPKGAWKKILTSAGISDLHLHDLRRSLGSWMAAGGASLPMIGRQLGHHDVQTTAIYSRLNVEPVRVFVDGAVEAILKAATPPKAKKATKAHAATK